MNGSDSAAVASLVFSIGLGVVGLVLIFVGA